MTNQPAHYETRLNYITIALFAGLVVLTIYGVLTLPDRIPIHFNLSGKADRWGHPTNLLVLPLLCLLIEGLLWAIRWAPPELMNFPGPRTAGNMARQMQNIMRMLAITRPLVAALFLGLVSQWIWVATHTPSRLAIWIPFVFVGLLLFSTGVFMVRAYRMASQR